MRAGWEQGGRRRRVAWSDPGLARGVPPAVTAASGMDALTQCLEALVCSRAQPMTDALCVDGIQRAMRSLEKAFHQGDDLDAREDMALCALYSLSLIQFSEPTEQY